MIRAARDRPRSKLLLRTAQLAAAMALVALLLGLLYELWLPSVTAAPARVAAIVRAHQGQVDQLPVPAKLGAAAVAVEDEHFYANVAVDVLAGMGRATLATLQRGGDPGGSTIAQQLAKRLYGKGNGVVTKLQDIGLGVKLSLQYSKPEILIMYLNVDYYGHGYWGDQAAARGYFATSPAHLTWAEAAMLAGLLRAPSAYDPLRHFGAAKQRQREVLHQLVVNHFLTATQAAAAYRAPLHLR